MAEEKRDQLSNSLLLVAIAGVIIGLFPQWGSHTDPETNEQVTEWTLGFSFSPLWKYKQRQSPDGSFHSEWGLQFLSWSCIPIIVAAASLKLRTRRRSKGKKDNMPHGKRAGRSRIDEPIL